MLENEVGKIDKEMSNWRKLLAFLLILGLCFFVGNVVLIALAMAGGLTIEEGVDVLGAMSDPALKSYIKAGIGLNHLIMFTGTAVLFAYWLKRGKWKVYFDTYRLDFGLLWSFILLLVCAYPLISASAVVLEGVEWASEMDQSSIDALMKMLDMDGFSDLLVNLMIVALLPAIGEELLFRGVLQKELIALMKSPHVAIFVTSIIFSGFHLQVQGFLPKLIIGLILGYAYYWTKSIWYPMILHFINNAIPTFALYMVGERLEGIEEEALAPEKLYLFIGVVFSCFLCYLIIQNILNQLEERRAMHD